MERLDGVFAIVACGRCSRLLRTAVRLIALGPASSLMSRTDLALIGIWPLLNLEQSRFDIAVFQKRSLDETRPLRAR